MLSIACLLGVLCALSLLSSVAPFTPSLAFLPRSHASPTVTTIFSSPGGAPAYAPPKVDIKKKTAPPKGAQDQKVQVGQPQTRAEVEVEDAPRYKVMLLGDESYTESHVVPRITNVVDDVDTKQAQSVYTACMSAGKGLVGVYPMEIAEHYVEQFLRSEPMIFSEMVKEGKS